MSIGLEEAGSRIYITGESYGIKDRLKNAGCHWDADRRQWWIGKAKRAEIDSIVKSAGTTHPKTESPNEIKVIGKARYKGRSYYIRWIGECKSGEYKARLTTLDAKIDFWAKAARPHELTQIDGNGDIARTEKIYQESKTLSSIQRFLNEIKQDEEDKKNGAAETKICWECGCSFTRLDASRNDGDWASSYCGC